ncbi:MAG: TA system VapC family ribonuclease toxin [Gemmatimonadaceae bacterium]
MFVVDTNLLLYAVNPDAPEHPSAHGLVEEWRRGDRSWFLTWSIIYEFLRVSTHPRVFSRPLDLPRAQAWIVTLLACPSASILVPTDRHMEVLRELAVRLPRLRGNIVHDLHTAALMREHGVSEIRTADLDFHQFAFLDVINPLADARA